MSVPITYNIRNLIERKGTTLMTAAGIGLTVAVLTVALALTAGLAAVFSQSGHPRQFLVLRKGIDSELNSSVSEEAIQIIRRLPGVAVTATGEPMVSPEGLTIVNLPSVDSPQGMNVTVRGLTQVGTKMRDLRVTGGHMIEPGKRQIVVGANIARRYPTAQIGNQIRFGRGYWEIVGVFDAGGQGTAGGQSASNSEIWADLNQLRGDFERGGGASSILVRAESPASFERLTKIIADDQRLSVGTLSEHDYYASMTKSGAPLMGLGFAVAVIMAIGSAFAATNTMYAAVARRSREIGTLRALGFTRAAILRSFILESIFLSLTGGLIGVLIALPVNNLTTGIGNFTTFSEISFDLKVGPVQIFIGLFFAATIGAMGGFLPAWAAANKNPIQAMRDP